MKVFYKNSYKVIDGYTECINCPFSHSNLCPASSIWFNCGRSRLVLDNTQIFDL